MTEPTPKEIDDLVYELRQAGRDDTYSLVCAVLAKWGTPAPVGVEPVASVHRDTLAMLNSGQVRPWDDGARLYPASKARFDAAFVGVYTTPQPTQTQAGAVPLTDEMASKAGRALSDLYATECGVDKEDNWKVYGSDFIATAKLVLEAVGIKGGQHGTDTDN